MRKRPIRLRARDRAEPERFCSIGVNNVRLVNRVKIILALDTSGDRTAERPGSHSGTSGSEPPDSKYRSA
jgi:hypothetical protein